MVYGQTQDDYSLDFDDSEGGSQSRISVVYGQTQNFDFLELLFSFEDLLSSFVESIRSEQLLWSKVSLFGFDSIISECAKCPQESPCGLGFLIYKLPLPGGVTVEPVGKITSLL